MKLLYSLKLLQTKAGTQMKVWMSLDKQKTTPTHLKNNALKISLFYENFLILTVSSEI